VWWLGGSSREGSRGCLNSISIKELAQVSCGLGGKNPKTSKTEALLLLGDAFEQEI